MCAQLQVVTCSLSVFSVANHVYAPEGTIEYREGTAVSEYAGEGRQVSRILKHRLSVMCLVQQRHVGNSCSMPKCLSACFYCFNVEKKKCPDQIDGRGWKARIYTRISKVPNVHSFDVCDIWYVYVPFSVHFTQPWTWVTRPSCAQLHLT